MAKKLYDDGCGGKIMPVAVRVMEFRRLYPDYGIDTAIVEHNTKEHSAVFNAAIKSETLVLASATAYACQNDYDNYIEAAENAAIGRALAVFGIGTEYAPDFCPIPAKPVKKKSDLEQAVNLIASMGTTETAAAYVLKEGKYKGMTLGETYKRDCAYVKEMYESDSVSAELKNNIYILSNAVRASRNGN